MYAWGRRGLTGVPTSHDLSSPEPVPGLEVRNKERNERLYFSVPCSVLLCLLAFSNVNLVLNECFSNLVILQGKAVAFISAGHYHSAAVTETGELYTWGIGTLFCICGALMILSLCHFLGVVVFVFAISELMDLVLLFCRQERPVGP